MIYRIRDLIKELKEIDPDKPIVVETPDGNTFQIQKVSSITSPVKIKL